MDLFDYMRENAMEKESPLASRLRPRTLDEVVGQQHIIGKDKLLYRAIKADKLGSVIFYGCLLYTSWKKVNGTYQMPDGNIILCHLAPIDLFLPSGYVNSTMEHILDGTSVRHLIGTVYFLPGIGICSSVTGGSV